MKYSVTLCFERKQSITVDANSEDEARDIVANGEFNDDQITDTEDDYVEITGVTKLE
jgi:DNA-dependent RNA polymerase auxiliary subunit epsilon